MRENKKRIAILFGGRSTEHNISLLSAKNVIKSIDKEKFAPILVAIDKNGIWHHIEDMAFLDKVSVNIEPLSGLKSPIILSQNNGQHLLYRLSDYSTIKIDVLYPVLHGTYGEDGSVQGLAKLAGLPCVGCGVIGAAVGMDKDIICLLYTSPSPRDATLSRMPSSA